jgi:ATP-binding cassette subfamily C protein
MLARHRAANGSPSDIRRALASIWPTFGGLIFVSGVINFLSLTGPLFMLQVYDRVLTSHSVPTLIALAGIGLFLYSAQGLIDHIRGLICTRLGTAFHERLSSRLYQLISALPMVTPGTGSDGMQAVRDLDAIRAFISGSGPAAFLDLPWMPIYFLLIYSLNPLLAYVTILGAVILMVLTLASDAVAVRLNTEAAAANARRYLLAEAGWHNAEIVRAMGLGQRLGTAFSNANADYLAHQQTLSDRTGGLTALTRIFRLVMQSGILALGAWIVLKGEMSGGGIIAASITSARALAPIEGVIAHWKGFVAARKGIQRLETMFARVPVQRVATLLPVPKRTLQVANLYVGPPGASAAILKNISFAVKAGQVVGVIGPSAAGKSTLARALVGVWTPFSGDVRLDDASLDQWDGETRGSFTGYLPQDVELFEGTIAENIARFDQAASSHAIIEAAMAANVHTMIVGMEQGYDTPIGEGGAVLSAGQRQRIGLARALYGHPFLVVLDEPNSNLDAEGEAALGAAIQALKQRHCIVILIAHRSNAIAHVDLLAVIDLGRMRIFGPKEDVIRQLKEEATPIDQQKAGLKRAGASV